MSVYEAVEREIEGFGDASPALAASALALAAELDDNGNSATSKSMCARALAETLKELRGLAKPKKERDELDEIRERRATRLAAGGAAT